MSMSTACSCPEPSCSLPPSEMLAPSTPSPSDSVWRTKSSSPTSTRTVDGLMRCTPLETRVPRS